MSALFLLGLALASPGLEAANAAHLDGDGAAAARGYADLIDGGQVSADLYYNLGNSHFQDGQLGHAILSWRRAQLLAPRDGDIAANLDHARLQAQDRLELPSDGGALFWRSTLSLKEQGWTATLLLGLLGLLACLWRLRPALPLGIPALLVGVPGLALGLGTWVELTELGSQAVVLAPVQVDSGSGVVLFELHPGAEVQFREAAADRAQIELPDGRRGWMDLASLGVVDPRLPAPRAAAR
jgi:hypothetical protein